MIENSYILQKHLLEDTSMLYNYILQESLFCIIENILQ
jgi:hypothetical protein